MTTPRPLISAMQVTLDGYSSEGDAEWVDSWADGLGLLPPVDAFVLGGGMFPQYEQFWATILDDPGTAAEWLGRDVYPREVAYARHAAGTPHLVLSKTLTEASWPSARIIDDIAEIRALKQQPGQAVYVVGGGLAVFGGLVEPQAVELVSAEPTPTGRLHLTYRVAAAAEPIQ